MQRQSIGSPTRVHAAIGEVAPTAPEAEEVKPEKPVRPSYTTERSVHLIPLLTLLCLLVLYLSSHNPSITDVAGIGDASGFIHGGNLMSEGGAIVNHRGLKANAKLHIRKLGSAKHRASAGETGTSRRIKLYYERVNEKQD